jgi:hypothetical protein
MLVLESGLTAHARPGEQTTTMSPTHCFFTARCREKEIGGSGGSLEPPGPLLTHLHTVSMAYSECVPTRLNPLAERTCFSQARWAVLH